MIIVSFPLESRALRLASIGSSSLNLLVSTHASSQRDIDTGRGGETIALRNFDQVKLVDVEY